MSGITRQSIVSVAVLAAFSAILFGCGRSAPEKETDAQPDAPGDVEAEIMEPDKLGELFSKADTLFSEGSTNDAVACLEQGLADPELAAISSSVVRELAHFGKNITPFLPEGFPKI